MAASLESPLQASAATSIAKLDTSTLLLLGFPSPILLVPLVGYWSAGIVSGKNGRPKNYTCNQKVLGGSND
ncbi:hypothetical protein BVRB_9g215290 [Beta vulgaris subsp. vulgaris]|nr:hypothetical protein BVRB_9g215290 [Beta vulgaris subsp. vulgaris]